MAAAGALALGEWVIHLPVLDVLIGLPVQLLGLFVMPPLAVRWFVEGRSFEEDVEKQIGKILAALGLKK